MVSKSLIGNKYGKLTVISEEPPKIKSGIKRRYWLCECECGNTRVVLQNIIKRKSVQECFECKKDCVSTTPEYHAWCNMRCRCNNPGHPEYPNYGGRGIKVDPEFNNSFEAFLAEIGPRPISGKWCLDREDNEQGYIPGNIRWVPRNVSDTNKRTPRNNTSGEKHICVDKRYDNWKYRVALKRKGVRYNLGGYDSMAEAVKARDNFIKNYGY